MRVIQQGLRSAEERLVRPRWTVQTRVWPEVSDRIPVAVMPLTVTSRFGQICARLVGLSVGKGLPSARAGFVHDLVADDCGVAIAPVEHLV